MKGAERKRCAFEEGEPATIVVHLTFSRGIEADMDYCTAHAMQVLAMPRGRRVSKVEVPEMRQENVA